MNYHYYFRCFLLNAPMNCFLMNYYPMNAMNFQRSYCKISNFLMKRGICCNYPSYCFLMMACGYNCCYLNYLKGYGYSFLNYYPKMGYGCKYPNYLFLVPLSILKTVFLHFHCSMVW